MTKRKNDARPPELFEDVHIRDVIDYSGQQHEARVLLMKDRPLVKVATMTDRQVNDELDDLYTVVGKRGEQVLLIRRDNLEQLEKLLVILSR